VLDFDGVAVNIEVHERGSHAPSWGQWGSKYPAGATHSQHSPIGYLAERRCQCSVRPSPTAFETLKASVIQGYASAPRFHPASFAPAS
jgi:hypothetical protein